METIKTYLDNMFSGVVQTDEMIQLKSDIYDNMMEKYQELKDQGKSENEAIGVVISEFGNIDELLEAYDIQREEKRREGSEEPEISLEYAKEFLDFKKKASYLIASGVLLCFVGVISLIMLSGSFRSVGSDMVQWEFGSSIGVIALFLFVALAVPIFIYTGVQSTKYEYLQKTVYYLNPYTIKQIQEERDQFQPQFTVKIIIGVVLCILSPITLIIMSMAPGIEDRGYLLGVGIMFVIVAAAVFLFITAGMRHSAYQMLLQEGDYTPARKRGNRVVEVVGSVVWPLVVILYLYLGFVHGLWHPGWIVFPVTGVIFGVFSSLAGEHIKK